MKASSLLAAGLFGLAACTSGGTPTARWSASAWDGLAGQTIGTDNYNFFAAPLDGQGFKLKLPLLWTATSGYRRAMTRWPPSLKKPRARRRLKAAHFPR